MSVPLEDLPFTEFIQRPTAATGRLATVRALRLRRRDADDLVVMSAARAEHEREVIEVTEAAASVDNMSPIAQLLIEWRHTAEVHADPELHALLSAPRGEDHGPVLPPDPQDGA